MNIKVALFFVLYFLFSGIVNSDVNKKNKEEIEHLMLYVKNSECIFNRNGEDYKGSDAVTHIKRKYDYFKEEIKTTEDFVALSATKSEISGEKYKVKCKQGEAEELGQWLLHVLSSFRETLANSSMN
jgi:hypothetical protein